jgi:TolB protein
MSVNDVDRLLTAWLTDDAPGHEPDHLLEQVLARTSRTRRRPGWSIPERWLSVQLTMRWRPTPSLAPVVLIILLVLALIAAILLVGSGPRLPPPFGPAANGLLAYMRGPQLVLSAPDGSGVRSLTAPSTMAGQPVFSPLGRKIAYKLYATADSTQTSALFVADVASGTSVRLTEFGDSISTPSWSPDERWLVFSQRTAGPFSTRIFVVPADGSAPLREIGPTGVASADLLDPTFSPDGRTIAYVHQGLRFARVSVMDADGSDPRDLSADRFAIVGGGAHHGGSPLAWHPSSDRLLVTADSTADDRDLFVVGLDGSIRHLASPSVPDDLEFGASWSPQGERIVFLRGDGFPELVVAAADGSDPRVISAGVTLAWFTPQWSPDGRFVIATEGGPGNTSTVYLFDPDGVRPPVTIVGTAFPTPDDEAPGGSDIVAMQRRAP